MAHSCGGIVKRCGSADWRESGEAVFGAVIATGKTSGFGVACA